MVYTNKPTKFLFLFLMILPFLYLSPIIVKAKQLVAPWEPWEPFSYKDTSENLTGLDVELMKSIVKNMNNNGERYTLKYLQMPWARVLHSLNVGKVIHFASGGAVTPKRAETMNFSDPYRVETYAIYVKKKRTWKVQRN